MSKWIITWPDSTDILVEPGDHLTLEARGSRIAELYLDCSSTWLGKPNEPIPGPSFLTGYRPGWFRNSMFLHQHNPRTGESRYFRLNRAQLRRMWVIHIPSDRSEQRWKRIAMASSAEVANAEVASGDGRSGLYNRARA